MNFEQEYRMCTQCVMDTTDPDIEFDENGVCNHCNYFANYVKPYWHFDQRGEKALQGIIKEIKEYGKNSQYDCIIGISGGVDSSYLAVKVVEWGLRPLAVHVDAGWNSELAVKNIEQIIVKLGLDLVTEVVEWEDMKELQLAFLRSNVANQDVPQDHAFFAALYHYAIKNKIKYVISGCNHATESILPQAWGYNAMDARHIRSIHRRFGTRRLRRFPIINFLEYYFYYPEIKKLRVLYPLNHISYKKSTAIDYLEKNYGWRYYGGKHYESRWTHFYQAYYLPTKFGYDKRKAHLSSMVVAGEISRDDALEELEKPLYSENELAADKAFVAKKLGITVADLDRLVREPARHYSEFPNQEYMLRRYLAARSWWENTAMRLRSACG